jgi:hypothetical protein
MSVLETRLKEIPSTQFRKKLYPRTIQQRNFQH